MLKVIDFSGNEVFNLVFIQVIDVIVFMANCKDIMVYLDEEGLVFIMFGDVDDVFFDVCGISECSIFKGIFDCDDFGFNIIIFGLKDGSDN